MCTADIFLSLIAILFPPLPVWVKRGLCSADSFINLALCLLGFIPGLLHAWYIISTTPDNYDYDYSTVPVDAERGQARVDYIIVQDNVSAPFPSPQLQPQHGYGTNGKPQKLGKGSAAGQGASSGEVPPPYAEAVRGDHKVQLH